jgi:hypothetical protein
LPANEQHLDHSCRIYDNAQPPFNRLCKLEAIPSDKQAELLALHQVAKSITLCQEIIPPAPKASQYQEMTAYFFISNRKERCHSVTF